MTAHVRKFETGATRDLDASKLDFEGFLSPLVLARYAEYMHANRMTAEGLRESDNWQLGIPKSAYMKSGWRHHFAWWSAHRGEPTHEDIETAICGVLFNASGYLHEILKARGASIGTQIHDSQIAKDSADAAVAELLPPQPATIATDD